MGLVARGRNHSIETGQEGCSAGIEQIPLGQKPCEAETVFSISGSCGVLAWGGPRKPVCRRRTCGPPGARAGSPASAESADKSRQAGFQEGASLQEPKPYPSSASPWELSVDKGLPLLLQTRLTHHASSRELRVGREKHQAVTLLSFLNQGSYTVIISKSRQLHCYHF